jgi:hypothetical protein
LHDLDVLQSLDFDFPDLAPGTFGMLPQASTDPNLYRLSGISVFFRSDCIKPLKKICDGVRSTEKRTSAEHVLVKLLGNNEFQIGRDFTEINRSFGYNFKPTIRHRRNKGDYSHMLDEVEFPINVVDFNYAPPHHGKMWRRGHKISKRLKKILYPEYYT